MIITYNSRKKLNGNEKKDDNDCHNLRVFKILRFNLMDQIQTNVRTNLKRVEEKNNKRPKENKPLVTRTSPSRASSQIL